jgi:23S rRNA (uracil1939-C5)-methyltransferase
MPVTRITDLSFTGEGVGREGGKVVFLPFTLPGEVVEWERIETKKTFDRGLPRRILEPSPLRIRPTCPLFERCGGCQLQHLDFRTQAEEKERLFRRLAAHTLKTEALSFLPPLLSPQGFGYRHRLRLKTARQGKKVRVGFYHRRSRDLIPLDHCPLANRAVNAVLPPLQEVLQDLPPESGEPEVELTVADDPASALRGGILLELAQKTAHPRLRELTRELNALPGLAYAFFRVRGSFRLFGERPFDPERDALEYTIAGMREGASSIRLKVFPSVFSQANLEVNRLLIAELTGLDLFEASSDLIDLYCGMGNLSLPLSPFFRRVVGLEIFPPAVTNAEWNRKKNRIVNCTFLEGAAEKTKDLWTSRTSPKWVFLDPPRSGIKGLVSLLNEARGSIQGVLYLSCHPLTLLHDLDRLAAFGWKIVWMQMVDFFPQTFHQEWLVHLTP